MRKFIFVADYFLNEYLGGAELTSQALMDLCPGPSLKIKSNKVSAQLIQEHSDAYWIFFNFSEMKYELCNLIAEHLDYSIVEYDYKYCVHRSQDLHQLKEGMECNCRNYFLDAFFMNAKSVWFMSERQMNWLEKKIDYVHADNWFVLSSCFSESHLKKISELSKNPKNEKWALIYSASVIKGFDQAEQYCKENGLEYTVLKGLTYSQLLEELSKCKGLVYMPIGGDTCPRTVIEAKLLGCELKLNDSVEHAKELWFESMDLCQWHLDRNKNIFWKEIMRNVDKEATI